jgi:PTS system glucitol/sorbitol-specific IIA component
MHEVGCTILSIGKKATELAEMNMLILFSNEAPDDLKEYCIIHDQAQKIEALQENDHLYLGSKKYTIKAVGATAIDTFNALGHLTLKFNRSDDLLPGSIYLEEQLVEMPQIGNIISFRKGA